MDKPTSESAAEDLVETTVRRLTRAVANSDSDLDLIFAVIFEIGTSHESGGVTASMVEAVYEENGTPIPNEVLNALRDLDQAVEWFYEIANPKEE